MYQLFCPPMSYPIIVFLVTESMGLLLELILLQDCIVRDFVVVRMKYGVCDDVLIRSIPGLYYLSHFRLDRYF